MCVPIQAEGRRKVGQGIGHRGAAVGLSAAWSVAVRMGAQHPGGRSAPLLDNLQEPPGTAMIVHFIDGTYELFRHFYGQRRFNKGNDAPFGAVLGVLNTVLQMIETGATHIGVATDHIIESFRNDLWPGYKTGAGIERALWAQFTPLEEALDAMGVTVWPMVELEADDALASAAHL